jgi:hypothetical protein
MKTKEEVKEDTKKIKELNDEIISLLEKYTNENYLAFTFLKESIILTKNKSIQFLDNCY